MKIERILTGATLFLSVSSQFVHPGALHTRKDIERVRNKVHAQEQPWYRAWQHLESGVLAQTTWTPSPHEVLVRGTNASWKPTPSQNYGDAYRDAHSAYQLTLRWLIGGNTSYADHAATILNSWGTKLRDLNGTEDKYLAAGLYGYQFANAAEILRLYPGWTADSQAEFSDMLKRVFAPYNHAFLEHHNGKTNFYYANWDLCNVASLLAIGIFTDNRTMFDYATHYWQYGLPDSSVVVNGALPYFSIANFTEQGSGKPFMQMQESGRDQGHAMLCMALLGVIGQQAWNQGVDLFATYGNQILNAAEYVAKYNTNHTVPYVPYTSWEGLLDKISAKSRFDVRPGYEAIASHYTRVKNLNASWSIRFRDYVNGNISTDVEGGGGDYGPNSGGYDAFGHGTLMYRIESDA
ncbi:exopolysaccharide inner membrane protein-like protein [Aspergillus steynii IBT 23096]|uniref:Exopolysaccharide inner membrane protein-like protein n=1 Tax=Aspergillus steynii IBT 23096 TaxID=1392250 RepID=A0A2I2FX16_9EURO|nr:exopolysaccharide inner membrane protein-like protein [Aspergillus steynii IBT 23096]PLB45178.1 exopolysaccharide inner membrane protein-like protein [Aspergillus steynii IBT 23096]